MRFTTLTILALAAPASAGTINYAAGSLVLPTSASFQDDCGAVSVYGLVYDVLRANTWLAANGYAPITIHYAYNDTKGSPNRCLPTNLDTPPTNDPAWNDGCDFQIAGTSAPVKLVANANATSTAADTSVATIRTIGNADVWPQYASHTVTSSIGYLGGPFIISASDAPTFTKLLQGTLLAKDIYGSTIDFSAFRSNKGACSFGATHWVNIHRAQVAFSAPAGKDFTATPPRLALLATDRTGATGAIFDGILENYLANAGLDFTGAQGCPPGGANIGTSKCPGGGQRGQIFDIFDITDLKNNLQAAVDASGNRLYRMVWMPHWESTATNTIAPNLTEATALANLASFLDSPGGVMAECASISTLEGAYVHGSLGGCPGGASNYASCANRASATQYQTCVTNGAGSCAAAATTPWGINRDVKGYGNAFQTIKNCSDPTTAAGASCAYYSYPGDPYAQVADYVWNAQGYGSWWTGDGVVADFAPNPSTGSMYRPGVMPLISAVQSLDRTKLATAASARSMVVADLATRSVKDNAPNKANIAYVGGHDLTGTIAGTKLVLETLLQLGFNSTPPAGTMTEVSRASPVAALVAGQNAIVQGTFESVSPAPAVPTVTLAGDVAGFTFPYQKGHLRARTAGSISTTATSFSAGTLLFDAAIPNPSYTGCGAGAFNGTCRTVFTTNGAALRPSRVFIQDGNADTLGPIIAPGLAHAQWVTMVDRIVGAELGGIDRSTVAVVNQSSFTNTNRATVAYVGATDGMLHAFCASVDATHGCPALGKELWAFMPRGQLALVRTNTTRIDGSPRVADLYGDFTGTGLRSFRTILLFQSTSTTASYALDITDPQDPVVLWERSELGAGLTVGAGMSDIVPMAYFATNTGTTAGIAVAGVDVQTGTTRWTFRYTYPAPRVAGHQTVPATGVPGGAVTADRNGDGYLTDVVFGDLYGNVWELDPASGAIKLSHALFTFSSDYKPIGTPPTLYSQGGQIYAAFATGGYADLSGSTWGTGTQDLFSVRLSDGHLGFDITLGSNERGFAQARVVGTQLFVTTDTGDVNASTYGSGTTGRMYSVDLTGNVAASPYSVASGAGALANVGTTLVVSAGSAQQQLASSATTATGPSVDSGWFPHVIRRVWLRST